MIHHHGCDFAVTDALDRYGVELEAEDFDVMVFDIVQTLTDGVQRACLLAILSRRREHWIVRAPGGLAMRVVYDPVIARIISVLPAQWRWR